ncbi:MAG TPA: hypothetical protein VK335_02295 [Bryobacteraceae bacterium]|nr:hypothetical protein [Bryobacteraceae bacterium]
MKSELCSLSAAVSDPAKTVNRKTTMGLLGLGVLALSSGVAMAQQDVKPLIPLPPPSVSTVPSNGDVNPYGVAFVPNHFRTGGILNPGDILVSNFNNSQNLQGTGTTITRVTPAGATSTFYQGKAGLGLTAALVAVKHGLVFVGNMPTADGTSATVQPGSILVLDRNGELDGTLTDPTLINGPWGMAIHEEGNQAQMFVSNVLSGTVVRFDLSFFENSDAVQIRQKVQIASGYQHRGDPAALELGPSGLAYDAANDILYVASSLENAVFQINNAGSMMSDGGTGKMIYQDNTHLHGPIDLVLAPNGHLIVANSDGSNVDPNQPSEIVEFTTGGQFVAQFSVDPNNGGAFGVNLVNVGGAIRFAAVDDNKNALNLWTVPIQ